MYYLTLTTAERHAIDWVGHRYDHGYDLYKLLWVESEQTDNSLDWDSDDDITFRIPEAVSWKIAMIGEQCGHLWDCFSNALALKLNEFCMEIV
jgi:hypothetical protein